MTAPSRGTFSNCLGLDENGDPVVIVEIAGRRVATIPAKEPDEDEEEKPPDA